LDIVKEDMKKYFEREGKTNKTLSLKGRGEISFDNPLP